MMNFLVFCMAMAAQVNAAATAPKRSILQHAPLTPHVLDILERMPGHPLPTLQQPPQMQQHRTLASCRTVLDLYLDPLRDDAESDGDADLILSLANLFGIFKATNFQANRVAAQTQRFGTSGQYTNELIQRMAQMEAFWNPRFDAKLLAFKGSEWQDQTVLRQFVQYVFEPTRSYSVRDYQNDLNRAIRGLRGQYNSPLLTFSAVAISVYIECPSNDYNVRQPTIVMGDGMMEFIASQGFGVDGPDFVLAHEFSHLLQFDLEYNKIISSQDSADATRHRELEADAMAAYFMVKGGDHSVREVDELHVTARYIGDYQFTASSHHGTPAQRECAALWGATVAFNTNSEWNSLREFRNGGFNDAFQLILSGDELRECQDITVKESCGDDRVDLSRTSTTGGDETMMMFLVVMGVAGFLVVSFGVWAKTFFVPKRG